jgi:hypothetical protein
VRLIAEVLFQYQVNPCEIYGGRSGSRIGFSASTWIFPCHYHSSSAPPYSIIYHRRYIILAKYSVIKQSALKQLKSQITKQHRVGKKLNVKFASVLNMTTQRRVRGLEITVHELQDLH